MAKIIHLFPLLCFLFVEASSWCLKSSTSSSSSIDIIEYSYDRSFFATMSSGQVKLWSASNLQPLGTLAVGGTPSDIAFSPNSSMIAVGQSGSDIQFFSLTPPYS